MLWSLLIASLVLYPWSRNGVLRWVFFSPVRRSSVNCVIISSDDISGMFTCAGHNSTVLLALSLLLWLGYSSSSFLNDTLLVLYRITYYHDKTMFLFLVVVHVR